MPDVSNFVSLKGLNDLANDTEVVFFLLKTLRPEKTVAGLQDNCTYAGGQAQGYQRLNRCYGSSSRVLLYVHTYHEYWVTNQ